MKDKILSRCVEEGDCLIWQGPFSDSHMPVMHVPGHKGVRHVRRVLYRELHGEIPQGKVITPVCGNRACLCPQHLNAVTKKRSAQIAAKRGAFGHPAQIRKGLRTKLRDSWITPEVIEKIKAAPNGRIAAELTGVSHSHAKNIRNGTARQDYSNPFGQLLAANDSKRKAA